MPIFLKNISIAYSKTLFVLFFVFSVTLGAATSVSAKSPFTKLGGWWSGAGQMIMSDGSRQSIRCRATYFVENNGKSLRQNLRCVSRDIKIEAQSNLQHHGGKLSGTWKETTYEVGGNASGSVKGGRFTVYISSSNFSASMTLNVSGRRQSVVLRPQGLDIKRIQINLKKG